MNKNLSNAITIGTTCVLAYLASYITRNILSVSSPEMLKETFFSKEYVGLLSSVCFIFYAFGQLVNGFIGDKIHPKFMIGIGFFTSGIFTFIVPLFNNRLLHFLCFAAIGYALSMLRGPITKVISESTNIKYARVICTILNMAGFGGPVVASLLSLIFYWRTVFILTGLATVAIGIIMFTVLALLSKKGKINFKRDESKGIKSLFEVFKLENFIFFMTMSAISEVANTSITFWIPTYTIEFLGFSQKNASIIYSIISFSTLLAPVIALLIYDYIIRDAIKLSLLTYAVSAAFFIAVSVVKNPLVNICMFLLAKLAACCASGIVWSVYIPGLAKSGKVSSANGVIDASGYFLASVANAIFSGFMGKVGWRGIITLWCLIMLLGAIIAGIKKAHIRKQAFNNQE